MFVFVPLYGSIWSPVSSDLKSQGREEGGHGAQQFRTAGHYLCRKLSSYVKTIIQTSSQKQFQFSVTGRMQTYVLDIVEELYYANDIYLQSDNRAGWWA